MAKDIIIFEQPLSEILRVCLRLEDLFKQLNHQQSVDGNTHTMRQSVICLVRISHVVDRADFRTKLSQLISQVLANLEQLMARPEIDSQKLESVLSELQDCQNVLQQLNKRFGEELKTVPVLSQVSTKLSDLSGVCEFTCPLFALWLRQDNVKCQDEFNQWLASFKPLEGMITYVLRLIRHSVALKAVTAENGFYQQSLESSQPYHLIRVALPISVGLYPKISVGRHGVSMRLHSLQESITQKPMEVLNPVKLKLACCKI